MENLKNQEYNQDGVQENMNKELKTLNELNDKKKEITEKLDKPKKIADILNKVKNQISKIIKKEDIQAYKDFLTTVQNNIKDKVAPETITPEDISKDTYKIQLEYTDINTDIHDMLVSLSQKEGNLLEQQNLLNNKQLSITPIDTKKELEQHVQNFFDILARGKEFLSGDTSLEGRVLYNMYDFALKNINQHENSERKNEIESNFLSLFDEIQGEESITNFVNKSKALGEHINGKKNDTLNNYTDDIIRKELINCLRIQDLSQRHDALKRLFTDDGIINNDLNTHRNNNDSNNIVPSINKIGGNINKLTTSLNNLTDTEIQSFKGIIDSLNNETILPNQINAFSNMMNVLRQMNDVKKEDIMKAIDTYVDTKMQGKITTEQKDYFKKILGDVKEKGLINQFINQVDTSLEAQKRGGVDMLLPKITDTITPDELLEYKEVNGSLNAIFHHNQSEYNKFVTAYDTADATQKPKLEKILQTYVKSDYPDIDLTGVTIVRDNIQVKDKTDLTGQTKKDVPGFKFMKDGTVLKAKDGTDITPFFGDPLHGEAIPFDQTLKTTVGKNSLSAEGLKLPGMKNFVNQIQEIAGKKMSIADAFKSLFDSPLFAELKKIFLMLGISLSKDKDTQKDMSLSLAVLNIKDQFATGGEIKGKKIENGKEVDDPDVNKNHKRTGNPGLAKYLGGYEFNDKIKFDSKEHNEKEVFVQCNSIKLQMEYMMAKRVNDTTTVNRVFTEMLKGSNTQSDGKNTSAPQEKAPQGGTEAVSDKVVTKKFTSGKEYNELSLDGTKPGKVEKIDIDKNNPYLKIDGQVIPLINGKGSIFVKGDDGQIMEKVISFDKKDSKENIIITDGEKLDKGLLEKVHKDNKNLRKIGDSIEAQRIQKYYLLEGSPNRNSPLEQVINLSSQLLPDQKNKVEQTILLLKKEMYQKNGKDFTIGQASKLFKDFNTALSSIVIADQSKQQQRKNFIDKRIQSIGI